MISSVSYADLSRFDSGTRNTARNDKEVSSLIILEDDPIVEVAKMLKVEIYQVFYLAAQDECMGQPGQVAAHRAAQYHSEGYAVVPDYVKIFCETMKQALKRIGHTR